MPPETAWTTGRLSPHADPRRHDEGRADVRPGHWRVFLRSAPGGADAGAISTRTTALRCWPSIRSPTTAATRLRPRTGSSPIRSSATASASSSSRPARTAASASTAMTSPTSGRRSTSRGCRTPTIRPGFFQALAYHTADIQFVFPKWHGGHLGVNLDPLTGLPRELQGARDHAVRTRSWRRGRSSPGTATPTARAIRHGRACRSS